MSASPRKISDEALVVRGGRNHPEDIERGTATHPSGITGLSVQCSDTATIEELAKLIPHGRIGVTTVGEVRKVGGDVIRTAGRSSSHATLTGLKPDQVSRLLVPTIRSPARKNRGPKP